MPPNQTTKRRRRVNGEGSVYKRGDGYWVGAFDVPTTSGARKRVVLYGKTLTEARSTAEPAARAGATVRFSGEAESQLSSVSRSDWLSMAAPAWRWLRTLPSRLPSMTPRSGTGGYSLRAPAHACADPERPDQRERLYRETAIHPIREFGLAG